MLTLIDKNYSKLDYYLDHNKLLNWRKRGLTRDLSIVITDSDKKDIELYLDSLPSDKKLRAIPILKDYEITSNERNINKRISTLINDIALERRKLPTSADELYDKESQYDSLYGARILISQRKKCGYCNSFIKLTSKIDNAKIYKNYHIVDLNLNDSDKFNQLIALCPNCYCDYLNNYNNDLSYKLELNEKKKAFTKNDKKLELQEDSHLDDEIYDVLKAVKDNFSKYASSPQESYDVKKIEQKIPTNTELYHKVKNDCDVSFGYILKSLKRLDIDNNETYKKIRKEINNYFLDLEKLECDQSIIYEDIVTWILQQTHLEESHRLAAQKVVSFFIQICEVFHEIS